MGYAEVRKLHDIKLLHHGGVGAGRDEVLRIVLAVALDPEMAVWCLGLNADRPVTRWPSTLYRVLAQAAVESPRVWRRCALVLDRTLHEEVQSYADHAPAEIAEAFLEGRESLDGYDLAALLWCLVRRRSPSLDLIAERLSLELEVVAARRLHEAPSG